MKRSLKKKVRRAAKDPAFVAELERLAYSDDLIDEVRVAAYARAPQAFHGRLYPDLKYRDSRAPAAFTEALGIRMTPHQEMLARKFAPPVDGLLEASGDAFRGLPEYIASVTDQGATASSTGHAYALAAGHLPHVRELVVESPPQHFKRGMMIPLDAEALAALLPHATPEEHEDGSESAHDDGGGGEAPPERDR